MLQRKLRRDSEFYITVNYKRRNQCYKVKHQSLNDEEEIFNIISNNRTVVVTSKRPQFCTQVIMDYKQVYTYDDHEITNKCLMNRIIEAIDKHAGMGAGKR
ncbi:hypothetical protein OCK74_16090 [Chitinophagaceae bacterium LB-8]|uniref:Uncharacterized protein n=1 Tax=Paraflavisolibacter caeni TaxID=2982496 RepID=A0A9X3B8E9_9BACT|nr:hypothetical protein [Paraflavisolibacter caeni]MCU7550640.1 hypothetical protein [Paraflavisolibacter caeni]